MGGKKEEIVDQVDENERNWDIAWNLFCTGGPEPPAHPKADHAYNIDKKKYIALKMNVAGG